MFKPINKKKIDKTRFKNKQLLTKRRIKENDNFFSTLKVNFRASIYNVASLFLM